MSMPMRAVLSISVLFVCGSGAAAAAEPSVAGYVERACLASSPGKKVCISAKLDTGAETSSLHAGNMQFFHREGRNWLSFELVDEDRIKHWFDGPVLRWASVKRVGAPVERRPVVRIRLCVAGKRAMADITLTDRNGMAHKMLIGRAFLKGRILVDSAKTFAAKARCKPTLRSAR